MRALLYVVAVLFLIAAGIAAALGGEHTAADPGDALIGLGALGTGAALGACFLVLCGQYLARPGTAVGAVLGLVLTCALLGAVVTLTVGQAGITGTEPVATIVWGHAAVVGACLLIWGGQAGRRRGVEGKAAIGLVFWYFVGLGLLLFATKLLGLGVGVLLSLHPEQMNEFSFAWVMGGLPMGVLFLCGGIAALVAAGRIGTTVIPVTRAR